LSAFPHGGSASIFCCIGQVSPIGFHQHLMLAGGAATFSFGRRHVAFPHTKILKNTIKQKLCEQKKKKKKAAKSPLCLIILFPTPKY
jgi:hypothetical protein